MTRSRSLEKEGRYAISNVAYLHCVIKKNCLYADDIRMASSNKSRLLKLFNAIKKNIEVGLIINGSKTQYMIASANELPIPIDLVIDHRTFKGSDSRR